MDRLEQIRQTVDQILLSQPDPETRRAGFVHLYGVSATCTLLALHRGLDPELAAVAGMLHDIWTYQTGDSTDHAAHGARQAGHLLAESGAFTPAEIEGICQAISVHSDKAHRGAPLSETLTDADVLQQYLYNPKLMGDPHPHWSARLSRTLAELALPPHRGK